MCGRGQWRGFHSRYLKTPDGQQSPLVVMEQCTECGDYRAKDIENCAYVAPDEEKDVQQNDGVPDPESSSGDGSVWGPNSDGASGGPDSW